MARGGKLAQPHTRSHWDHRGRHGGSVGRGGTVSCCCIQSGEGQLMGEKHSQYDKYKSVITPVLRGEYLWQEIISRLVVFESCWLLAVCCVCLCVHMCVRERKRVWLKFERKLSTRLSPLLKHSSLAQNMFVPHAKQVCLQHNKHVRLLFGS